MQTPSVRRPFSLTREGRHFAVGMVCGVLLAVAGTALAQDDDPAPDLMQTVWYTLIELAIDTERNATGIAELRERLEDLELDLAEMAGDKN